MRIIITQVEIEEAIKAFVLGQITVAPGQTVSVNFKNTRGDDGATAEIDISAGESLAPAVTKPTTTPVKRAPVATKTTEMPVVQEQVQTSQETQDAIAEAAEAEAVDVTAVPEEDVTTIEEPKEEATTVSEEAPVAEAKPSTSLFAGLKRPQN